MSHLISITRLTVVVGAGASGATCLSQLSQLSREVGGVSVIWVTRRPGDSPPYAVIEGDQLPGREALYRLANRLAAGEEEEEGVRVRYLSERGVTRLARGEDGRLSVRLLSLSTGEEEELAGVDTVIAAVGYRPDTSLTRELQVHYCYATEGPMKLAASLLAAGRRYIRALLSLVKLLHYCALIGREIDEMMK